MSQFTVYLIDDEPELLDLLAEVAEESGLRAQSYTRASRFFEQVTQFETNSILVLDLCIPEMDGIEVMGKLAQMENPPALLLISGREAGLLHSAEKLGRARNLSIIGSLTKPMIIGEFQEMLEKYVSAKTKQ
ncbi:MAG: response regulator [Gammaproteobacteria bacterium]|nr:response regulator [Gammaproteobacteria bacterium]